MRKHHMKYIGKAAIFCVLLLLCLGMVNRILVPKYTFNSVWSTTNTYLGFYEMEENSVDVLFLGNSHAASSFSPQELYNSFGITSYNLACEQQSMLTSYYWLKEALRFQSPQIVVLDCHLLFPNYLDSVLNSDEGCTRKAFDHMKWSSVKREAIEDICSLDSNHSKISYYLPNIRYHTRWKELLESDFSYGEIHAHHELKGYNVLPYCVGYQEYVPYEEGTVTDQAEVVPVMGEYLDRIIQLCKEEGITLILTETPSTYASVERHNTIRELANAKEVLFIDFNERNVYEVLGYDFPVDNCDYGHANIWGATKMTSYMGGVFGQLGVIGKHDIQWEETKDYYTFIQNECTIRYITDIHTYLTAINQPEYTIFIAVREEAAAGLDTQTISELQELGLTVELAGNIGSSYLAVISTEGIVEENGYERLELHGTFRGGKSTYEMISAGADSGSICSIVIDGVEYAKNGKGLNIVVYNNVTKTVVDSIRFTTFDTGDGFR